MGKIISIIRGSLSVRRIQRLGRVPFSKLFHESKHSRSFFDKLKAGRKREYFRRLYKGLVRKRVKAIRRLKKTIPWGALYSAKHL